jgi:hypothetical protein
MQYFFIRYIVALLVIGVCRGKPNTADPEPASPTKPTPTEQFGNVWQLDSHGNYVYYQRIFFYITK